MQWPVVRRGPLKERPPRDDGEGYVSAALASSLRAVHAGRPVGQNTRQSLRAKIFHFPEFRIYGIHRPSRPCQRGVRDRHEMRAGLAVDAAAPARLRETGRETVSPHATRYDTARSQRLGWSSWASTRKPLMIRQNRPRTEKSCGPDARGLCVKS